MNTALWIVQGLLAVFFLGHAVLKFVLPEAAGHVGLALRSPRGSQARHRHSGADGCHRSRLAGNHSHRTAACPARGRGSHADDDRCGTLFHFTRGQYVQIPVNVVAFALAAFVAYGRIRLRPIAVTIR